MRQIAKSTVDNIVGKSWSYYLTVEFNENYMLKIMKFLKEERKRKPIYPKSPDVFKAFKLTPFDQVKVVIIGDEPYSSPNLADGLAFSISNETDKIPASLNNIITEVNKDMNYNKQPLENWDNYDLSRWAKQGVFLLNRSLTVEINKPNSHSSIGWYRFTKYVLDLLIERFHPTVFLLWGNNAQNLKPLIEDQGIHYVLTASHPAPSTYEKSFKDCCHFIKTNNFLKEMNLTQIDW